MQFRHECILDFIANKAIIGLYKISYDFSHFLQFLRRQLYLLQPD